MSSIEKLKIVGIRSFNPHAENVIEFHTPLTIIVGHNGAGKTTIIECLKYATTGEMPPNSKGGAFVHDPKVSRESDVKAQIKLKFRNTRQQVMVVTRSMQLTQSKGAKGTTSLKTLESLLSTVDPNSGEQVSISSRCAQLDSEMPFHLGVSKAVLQNVIFCHQEESMWPLSESSVLKKRFDEIFAAERYTKALDTLRSLRKQLVTDQRVEEEKLAGLKERRELALRLEADIRTADERIQETQAKIAGLDQEIVESNGQITRFTVEIERLSALQGDYERLQQELKMAEQSHQDLKMTMVTVMGDESDEELARLLAQHEERTRGAESQLARLKEQRDTMALSISALEKEHGGLLSERGKLWAEQALYERRSFDLDMALQDLFKGLGLSNQSGIRKDTIKLATDTFSGMQNNFNASMEQHRNEDLKLIEEIQALLGESTRLSETKASKEKQILETQNRLTSISSQLSSVKSAVEQTSQLASKLAIEESQLTSARDKHASMGYEEKFSNLLEKKGKLEAEIRTCNASLTELSKSSGERARLELLRTDAVKRVESFDRLLDDLRPDLATVKITYTGQQADDLDREVDRALRGKERELKAMQERLEAARSALSGTESKLEHLQQAQAKHERDLMEKGKRIQKILPADEDFAGVLEDTESELASTINALTLAQSSRSTYEAFQKALSSNHACPLCERACDGQVEHSLAAKLSSLLLGTMPSALLEQEQKKRALSKRVDDLRALKPFVDDVERIRLLEMPELKRSISQADGDKERASLQVDDLASELAELTALIKSMTGVKRKTEELARLKNDLDQLRHEIASIEAKTMLINEGGESAEELQLRSGRLQSELSSLQAEYENLTAEHKSSQSALYELETLYRDTKEQLMKVQLAAADAVRLEEQSGELQTMLASLQQEIREIEEKIAPTSLQVDRLKANREARRLEHQQLETAERDRLASLSSLMSRVANLTSELDSRPASEAERLPLVEEEILTLESRINEARLGVTKLEQEASLMGREEAELTQRERTIKDNIALRKLDKRINDLQSKLASMHPIEMTGGDRASLQESLSRLQTKHSTLLGDRSGLQGELRQLQDQQFRHTQDLARSFPDYEASYLGQLVRVTACGAAIDDLERYSRALDQAIMRYHGHKMDELNRLIHELWMATYQGADIDTIEIRAASQADSTATGTARTYNYRVVMVKGDSDLDMRGRSSAGQRVLASLIIRLALAETFGQSCGILALDEPTTNLDKDNIEALAAALADIIRVRRQQANFQLVIITHDEEFVAMLGRYECADYYYRVFKDDQQYSTIEQQAFQGALN